MMASGVCSACVCGAKLNLGDRVLGELEKNSFIALPVNGGHSGLLPSKTMCPHPGEFAEEFYVQEFSCLHSFLSLLLL